MKGKHKLGQHREGESRAEEEESSRMLFDYP